MSERAKMSENDHEWEGQRVKDRYNSSEGERDIESVRRGKSERQRQRSLEGGRTRERSSQRVRRSTRVNAWMLGKTTSERGDE